MSNGRRREYARQRVFGECRASHKQQPTWLDGYLVYLIEVGLALALAHLVAMPHLLALLVLQRLPGRARLQERYHSVPLHHAYPQPRAPPFGS